MGRVTPLTRVPATVDAVLIFCNRLCDNLVVESPFASAASVDRWVAAQDVRPEAPAVAPAAFRTWRSPSGWSVFRYRPRSAPLGSLIWLPGGAFVRAITAEHWAVVVELADATGFEAVVGCYPLLPRVRAARAVNDLVGFVDAVNGGETKPLVVMGDSAGAGLGLAATQEMARRGLHLPAALAFVSPWVDLRLVDPGQPALEAGSPACAVAVSCTQEASAPRIPSSVLCSER